MARYRDAKNRIARRLGVNVFGRAKNPLAHKPHPPGMHGAKRKKKSDHGVQLEEKQKLRAVFGMVSDSQLRKYFARAARCHKNTPEVLMQFLECRLDTVVYRLRFAPTIFAAQQLVSHGHIDVDSKRVNIRSFQVRPGMEVSVRGKSKQLPVVVDSVKNANRTVPEYLELDEVSLLGKLLSLPTMGAIPTPIDINVPMVCDFIARKG